MKEAKSKRAKNEEVNGQGGKRDAPAPHGNCLPVNHIRRNVSNRERKSVIMHVLPQ